MSSHSTLNHYEEASKKMQICGFCDHPHNMHQDIHGIKPKTFYSVCIHDLACDCIITIPCRKVSMILVLFKSDKVIYDCLNSLSRIVEKLSPDIYLDVYLVNNSPFTLQEIYPNLNINIINNTKNLGLSRATNQVFELSDSDHFILCNPDVIFPDNFVDFIKFGVTEYSHDIIGPSLVNMDGSPQRYIHSRVTDTTRLFFCFSILGPFIDRHFLNRRFSKFYSYKDTDMTHHFKVQQLGTCEMISRNVIHEIGGYIYDERLPIYFSDVDLSVRARKQFISSYVLTEIKLKHHLGHSHKGVNPFLQRFIFCRDMISYVKIHGPSIKLIRLLFFIDAVISFPIISIVLLKRKSRRILRFSTEQVRGIILGGNFQ